MNKWMQGTLGISAAGLLVLLATNGKALIDVALGVWLFLLKLCETAPMGLASFALAFAIAVFSQPFVHRALREVHCDASKDFLAMCAALVVGVGVMLLQLPTTKGALLGILAGLLAPFAWKGIDAIAGLVLTRADFGVDP